MDVEFEMESLANDLRRGAYGDDSHVVATEALAELRRLRDVITRLRDENQELGAAFITLDGQCEDLEAENARLRERAGKAVAALREMTRANPVGTSHTVHPYGWTAASYASKVLAILDAAPAGEGGGRVKATLVLEDLGTADRPAWSFDLRSEGQMTAVFGFDSEGEARGAAREYAEEFGLELGRKAIKGDE